MVRTLTTRTLARVSSATLAMLFLAACSSSSSSPAGSTGDGGGGGGGGGGGDNSSKQAAVCAAIVKADAQALLKGTITSSVPKAFECDFVVDANTTLEVDFSLTDSDSSDYNNLQSFPPNNTITGIGDEAYWNEPVAQESLPELSAHKGNATCVIQPPDDASATTCVYTGVSHVADSDALAYVQLMGKVCNEVLNAAQ